MATNKPFDVVLKALVEADPGGWPEVLGLPQAPLTVIDADVSAVGGSADKVLRVDSDPPYLLHLDFYAGHDTAQAPKKLRWYNAVLDVRHDRLVRSVAVVLRREADSPQLTGELVRAFPGRPPHVVFRYDVLRVWQTPAETFLRGSLSLLPLAPVGAVPERELPGVIDQMKQRLGRRQARALAGELWTATFVLLGMKYSRELALQLLRGITAMEESTTFQYIVELGQARGQVEEARQILLRIGRKMFGAPDEETTSRINAITDRERLEQLVEKSLDVNSWEELLGPPPRRSRTRSRRSSSSN